VKTIPKGERAWLARYRPEDFERPAVAVDVVILTVTDAELRALLILRDEPPFKGRWALPGGFLRVGKGGDRSLDDAAARELEEETGLSRARVTLAQLEAFGDEGRDPRTRVVSVAYVALVRPDLVPLVRGGGDAARAEWFSVDAPPRLAFDHERILARARAHISEQLQNTRVLRELVPPTFTIPELGARVRCARRPGELPPSCVADGAGRHPRGGTGQARDRLEARAGVALPLMRSW
jgi:8-oxo-dGTP diphosphatase